MSTEEHNEHPVTLTHFILASQQHHPKASGDLSILLHSIEIASKYVSAKVRSAGLLNLYGLQGKTNVQGEEVKKLDVIANEAFITSLQRCQKVCVMVSEENADPIIVAGKGKYAVMFDPLDGSSNIDVNVSIGTIFGIYQRESSTDLNTCGCITDLLQPGNRLVAAGYTLYGSATLLVLTTGCGVNGFTLDPTTGEFVLTHPDIKMPKRGKIYSVNEGNSQFWGPAVRKYIDGIKNAKSPYSLRYVGSMVADVHRTLIYGGIFMYPEDSRTPTGKLRLLYEANPMAFIMEQAGGKGTTGTQRVLDISPKTIHDRTPVALGSFDDVSDLEKCYAEAEGKK